MEHQCNTTFTSHSARSCRHRHCIVKKISRAKQCLRYRNLDSYSLNALTLNIIRHIDVENICRLIVRCSNRCVAHAIAHLNIAEVVCKFCAEVETERLIATPNILLAHKIYPTALCNRELESKISVICAIISSLTREQSGKNKGK